MTATANIKFNLTTDNVQSVQASIAQIFAAYAALTSSGLGAIAIDVSTGGTQSALVDSAQRPQVFTAMAHGDTYELTPATPSATSNNEDAGDTPTTATHDKTGLPWDARIHSTPATVTSKGVWRKRKGVDDITVAAVEAELRGGAVQQPAATTTLQAPAMPSMPAAQAPAAPSVYEQLVALIGANLHTATNPTGRITDDWVKQALATFGVTNGDLPNVAMMPAENQTAILNGFKQALGVA